MTLNLPKNDIIDLTQESDLIDALDTPIQHQFLTLAHAFKLKPWIEYRAQQSLPHAHTQELDNATSCLLPIQKRDNPTVETLKSEPVTARCDALGRVWVALSDVTIEALEDLQLAIRDRTNKNETPSLMRQVKRMADRKSSVSSKEAGTGEGKGGKQGSRIFFKKVTAEKGKGDKQKSSVAKSVTTQSQTVPKSELLTAGGHSLPTQLYDTGRAALPPISTDPVEALLQELQEMRIRGSHFLDLPVLVVEHKKKDENTLAKGTNQMRLYLTACVKFLHAIGIQEFVVYGMLTNGPHAIFPAAVMDAHGVCST